MYEDVPFTAQAAHPRARRQREKNSSRVAPACRGVHATTGTACREASSTQPSPPCDSGCPPPPGPGRTPERRSRVRGKASGWGGKGRPAAQGRPPCCARRRLQHSLQPTHLAAVRLGRPAALPSCCPPCEGVKAMEVEGGSADGDDFTRTSRSRTAAATPVPAPAACTLRPWPRSPILSTQGALFSRSVDRQAPHKPARRRALRQPRPGSPARPAAPSVSSSGGCKAS